MLIALHKPYGVLSQFTPDEPGQRTLAEFGLPASVYPIGRLDRDSEGLLLLSDEPRLTSALLDPRRKVAKTYLVQVERAIDGEAICRLRAGVEIRIKKRAYLTSAAVADRIAEPDLPPRDPPVRFRKTVQTSWLRLVITEGKNRQVRRMCAAVGFPVLRLVRARVGPYRLADLSPGQWRELAVTHRE